MCVLSQSQNIGSSPEYIKALTADWKGEWFEDGRSKVSDDVLERLKNILLEEAWAELIELGYHNQFEGKLKLTSGNGQKKMLINCPCRRKH